MSSERPLWKQAAVPAKHGGWGLTLEPILLVGTPLPAVPTLTRNPARAGSAFMRRSGLVFGSDSSR